MVEPPPIDLTIGVPNMPRLRQIRSEAKDLVEPRRIELLTS